MKTYGKIIKIDMHTLRAAAERAERSGGRMELTSFGVAVKIGDAVQVIPWLTVTSATSNVVDEAVTKVISASKVNSPYAGIDKSELLQQPTPSGHATVQQSDEWFCHKCGKRWGIHENPPECV